MFNSFEGYLYSENKCFKTFCGNKMSNQDVDAVFDLGQAHTECGGVKLFC